MNELGTRRYTELVDRLNGICGMFRRFLELRIEEMENNNKSNKNNPKNDSRFILLRKDEDLGDRTFMGIFKNEKMAHEMISLFTTDGSKYEKIYLKDVDGE